MWREEHYATYVRDLSWLYLPRNEERKFCRMYEIRIRLQSNGPTRVKQIQNTTQQQRVVSPEYEGSTKVLRDHTARISRSGGERNMWRNKSSGENP